MQRKSIVLASCLVAICAVLVASGTLLADGIPCYCTLVGDLWFDSAAAAPKSGAGSTANNGGAPGTPNSWGSILNMTGTSPPPSPGVGAATAGPWNLDDDWYDMNGRGTWDLSFFLKDDYYVSAHAQVNAFDGGAVAAAWAKGKVTDQISGAWTEIARVGPPITNTSSPTSYTLTVTALAITPIDDYSFAFGEGSSQVIEGTTKTDVYCQTVDDADATGDAESGLRGGGASFWTVTTKTHSDFCPYWPN